MDLWNRASHRLTRYAGSKRFFSAVIVLVAAWGVIGVANGPSRAWELSVTCGVPVATLLLVIVLQHAQNRDSKAVQLKLNELLLTLEAPDSALIRAGHLGDEELEELGERYERKAEGSSAEPWQARPA